MNGVTIESAYYGDERSFANITKSLLGKITGGVLDVTADAQLKPTFEAAPETRLDTKDEKRIREQASQACGGEADQACMERTRLKLSEERLREKEMEDMSASVIKGDRLTLNVIDENGKRKKLITPAGQKLRLENIRGDASTKDMTLPTLDKFQENAIFMLTIIVSTFFWVFSIVAVYTLFMRQYEATGRDIFRMMGYGAAGASALFPGLGYLIIFGYFGLNAFLKEYVTQ
jgi:hypothetical protein